MPANRLHHLQVLHEPISVMAHIIKAKFPLSMFAFKVGPALARGNIFVLMAMRDQVVHALTISGGCVLERCRDDGQQISDHNFIITSSCSDVDYLKSKNGGGSFVYYYIYACMGLLPWHLSHSLS